MRLNLGYRRNSAWVRTWAGWRRLPAFSVRSPFGGASYNDIMLFIVQEGN